MNRDYVFHSSTRTFCSECGQMINGKIVYNDEGVYIIKNCPRDGEERVLLEEDSSWHLLKRDFDKPGTVTPCQTEVRMGCPYDCGLCPEHDQHTCIGLIEVTARCNLNCNICYACAGKGKDLSLDQIEKMMDFYMESEGNQAEILQISGGEPTLHPEILKIIQMARDKGFKYVMLNTNGIRLAEDLAFVEELAVFKGGFEIYLQFDGLTDEVYQKLRGVSLLDVKRKAIKNLTDFDIPITLVTTAENGINDRVLGELVVYGMNTNCIRGINFQPAAYFGRIGRQPEERRLTLSGILNRIDNQTNGLIKRDDFMPLPCNVERVAITYLLKGNKGFVPITRNKDMSKYTNIINNTFMFTVEDTMKSIKEEGLENFCSCCDIVADIMKLLPLNFAFKPKEEKLRFVDENTFRISVSSFVDIYNFDLKSMQKECVHIITPDLKRIPFSAYNMIHREKYNHYYY